MKKIRTHCILDVCQFNWKTYLTLVLVLLFGIQSNANAYNDMGAGKRSASLYALKGADLIRVFNLNGGDQQKTITGTVLDENGSPLPGASIVEKGTINGTQTDFDGNFTLEISSDATTLEVSYIGYGTKEISIDDQTTFSIQLTPEASSLDEVVVVGYGTTRKSEITGAVGMVSSEEILEQSSVNPLQNLRGKIAGVTVFTNSGAPGGNNK